jgi:hypothetical protein
MTGTLADPFQFLIIAYFVGPLPFSQIFADPAKSLEPVFP